MATKQAAGRASKPKVVARSSTPPKQIGGGFGGGNPLGVNARIGGQMTGSAGATPAAPNYSTPGAMGAVTPIAAPPVVTDPFLTPTDLANQALELSSVDQYLGSVDLQATNARIDAQQKQAAVDTAENRNLEAADWNTAARGLGQSSIRDTTKAQLSSDAAQSRSGTAASLKASNDYAAGEHNRADTVVKPAINSKYNELMKKNAQDVTDNSPPAPDGAEPASGAIGTDPGAIKGSQPGLPTKAPAVGPTGAATQQEQYTPVVKNGKFYHYYPSTGQYVYIRQAG